MKFRAQFRFRKPSATAWVTAWSESLQDMDFVMEMLRQSGFEAEFIRGTFLELRQKDMPLTDQNHHHDSILAYC